MAEAWGPPTARAAADKIRDIPENCTCMWTWGPPEFRWVRIAAKEDCPWHVHTLWKTP